MSCPCAHTDVLGAGQAVGELLPPAFALCPRWFEQAQLLPQEGVPFHTVLRPHFDNAFPNLILVFFVEGFSGSFIQRQEWFSDCEVARGIFQAV